MDAESCRQVRSSGQLPCSLPRLFPSYAPRCRLRRSGCACLGLRPCAKCLRLCLQTVPWNRPRSWSWLSSRLVLVERSSVGLASCDRFPLTWTDVSRALRSWWWQPLLRCLSQRVGFSCSPGPDGGLLSGPVTPFLEETIEVPMRVRSSSSLSGLRTVVLFPVFPRVFAPGLSWLPLTGFDFAGLVAWLILAPRSRNPHSQPGPFLSLHHILAFVRGELESTLVPSLTAALLG